MNAKTEDKPSQADIDAMGGEDTKPVEMPEGFEEIQAGDLPPEWDFVNKPVLQAVVVDKRKIKASKGDDKYETVALTVSKQGKKYVVWESYALSNLFSKVNPLDEIYIQFIGLKPSSGDKNDMKEYKTGFKLHESNVSG